jgi:hypothetical protein
MAVVWRWVFVRPDGTIRGFSIQDQANAETDAERMGCGLISCPPEVRKAADWIWTGKAFEPSQRPAAVWGWRQQRAEKYPPAKDQLEGLIKAVTFMASAYRDRPGAAEAFADLDAIAGQIAALKTAHPKG